MSKTDLAWAASHTGTSVVLVAPLNWCVRVSHATDVCLAVCQLHWAARRANDAPSFTPTASAESSPVLSDGKQGWAGVERVREERVCFAGASAERTRSSHSPLAPHHHLR